MNDTSCRVCLNEVNFTVSINEKIENRLIYEAINEIAKVMVGPSDGFSQYICINCLRRLEDSINFKVEIETSDQILKSRFRIENEDSKTEIKYLITELDPIQSNMNSLNCSFQQLSEGKHHLTSELDVETSQPLNNIIKTEIVLDEFESPVTSFKLPKSPKTKCKIKKKQKLNKSQVLRCCMCDKTFENAYQMEMHVQETHQFEIELNTQKSYELKIFKYLCKLCQQRFQRKSSIILHIADKTFIENPPARTEGRNPTPCHVCGKIYSNSYEVRTHYLRVHSKIKNFKCDICEQTFTNKPTLDYHVRNHGPKNYICEYCSRAFVDLKALRSHQHVHAVIKRYQCDFCQKSFGHKANIKAHVMQHVDPLNKPFKCDHCPKMYKWPEVLKAHTNSIHFGKHPYSCMFCKKGYASSFSKKYHENRCSENPKAITCKK